MFWIWVIFIPLILLSSNLVFLIKSRALSSSPQKRFAKAKTKPVKTPPAGHTPCNLTWFKLKILYQNANNKPSEKSVTAFEGANLPLVKDALKRALPFEKVLILQFVVSRRQINWPLRCFFRPIKDMS